MLEISLTVGGGGGTLGRSGTMGRRSPDDSCGSYLREAVAMPTQKRYYTTRVVRH